MSASFSGTAYDPIAAEFDSERTLHRDGKYLEFLLEKISPNSHVLDLGCGTGKPLGEIIIHGGHRLTGLDASQRMLDIARRRLPTAVLIHGLIETVSFQNPFDAVIMWDSLFHIPRNHHSGIIRNLGQWTSPGGLLMMSTGGSAEEGFTSEMFGHEFSYSGLPPAEVSYLLVSAGFDILVDEVDDPSSRGHVAIVARKQYA